MIGVCGYGFTGSGAVVDLLKEYEELHVISGMEFSLPYSPDGLLSLKANLVDYYARSASSIVAIRRFEKLIKGFNSPNSAWKKLSNNQFLQISEEYIDSLVQATWKGKLGFDITQYSWLTQRIKGSLLGRVQTFVDKKFKKYIPIVPIQTMKMSINPTDFEQKTKKYVDKLLRAFANNEKEIVLDQPFPANKPDFVFPFFESPKAIIVDRDPRDVFLLAKYVVLSEARFMPCDDVQEFINYYRSIRDSIDDSVLDDKILRINFEDLIYEYERTLHKIEGFLGLSEHTLPKKNFDPSRSVVNTKLFMKELDEKTRKEISMIEEQLSPWLYDFDSHGNIEADRNAKAF